jgi:soluble lytic murein transglycosylase
MKRLLLVGLIVCAILIAVGGYFFNQYWIHRYDALVARQAAVYQLDPDLVWSVIYEETYFRPWQAGRDGEIGLMQVTPTVGREWAAVTGMHDLERQMASDPHSLLSDPERNIQIGCWYLEKLYLQFRNVPDAETRMLAAYNAGPSRATEWNRTAAGAPALSGDEFIKRIEISSTRAYVTSIMERYRKLKQERGLGNSNQQRSLLISPHRLLREPGAVATGSLTQLFQADLTSLCPKRSSASFAHYRSGLSC